MEVQTWRQLQIMERAKYRRINLARKRRAARAGKTFFDMLKTAFAPPTRSVTPDASKVN